MTTTIRHSRLLAPLLTLLLLPAASVARADEVRFGFATIGGEPLNIRLASHRSHSHRSYGRHDDWRGRHGRHDKHYRYKKKHHSRREHHDHGSWRHGPSHRGHSYRGYGHRHFEIPRALQGHHHPYRDYYYGRVYYRGHRHYHDVYRFPVYSGYRVDYRPYAYCDGGFFASGFFGLHGPVFSIGIAF